MKKRLKNFYDKEFIYKNNFQKFLEKKKIKDENNLEKEESFFSSKNSEDLNRENPKEEDTTLLLVQEWQKTKDITALKNLLDRHYNLIRSIVHSEAGLNNIHYHSLLAEGISGLIPALEHFDTKKNVKFSTYLTFWIRAKIKKYLWTVGNFLEITYSPLVTLLRKLIYSNEYGLTNNDLKKIAHEQNVKESTIEDLYKSLSVNIINLRTELKDGGNFADIIPEEDNNEEESKHIHEILQKSIYLLSNKHRQVIELRWFNKEKKLTLLEVAEALGKSKEYVRKIEAEAFREIKDNMKYIDSTIFGFILKYYLFFSFFLFFSFLFYNK